MGVSYGNTLIVKHMYTTLGQANARPCVNVIEYPKNYIRYHVYYQLVSSICGIKSICISKNDCITIVDNI